MLTPYLAAGYLFAMQVSGPMDRLRMFLRNSDFLAVEISTVVNGAQPPIVCNYQWHKSGVRQRMTIQVGPERREFIQDPSMVMTMNHTGKTYQEYGRIPIFVNPPADDPLILFSYPGALTIPTLTSAATGTWKVGGRSVRNGITVEEATLTISGDTENATYQFFVDEAGKLISLISNRPTPAGNERIEQTFKNYRLGNVGQDKISADLPVGYMPEAIPRPTNTAVAGEIAPFGKWLDARTEKVTDVVAWAQGRRIVIVFTSAECPVSTAIEPALVAIQADLAKEKAELIEVILGPAKGDVAAKDRNRRIYWDKDGAIEGTFGINLTPYLLAMDTKNVILGGWIGFATEEQSRLRKTISDLFKPPPELE